MPKRRKEEQAAGFGQSGGPNRVTPVDIQQKEFRLAFRGYNERDVDQFLDEVTEEFARLYEENKRLREELGSHGTARIEAGGASEAEAIIRQARKEATRIVAEAESRVREISSALPPSSDDPSAKRVINAFLAREREFLQSLAGLIQGHAESVKDDIRRARPATAGSQPQTVPGSTGGAGGTMGSTSGSGSSNPGAPPPPTSGNPGPSGQPSASATLQADREAQTSVASERPPGSPTAHRVVDLGAGQESPVRRFESAPKSPAAESERAGGGDDPDRSGPPEEPGDEGDQSERDLFWRKD
jgi:cell division initiation protein